MRIQQHGGKLTEPYQFYLKANILLTFTQVPLIFRGNVSYQIDYYIY